MEAHISGRIGMDGDVPASSEKVRVCSPYPPLESIVLVLVFRRVRGSVSRSFVKGSSRPKDGVVFSRLKGGNIQENEGKEGGIRVRG